MDTNQLLGIEYEFSTRNIEDVISEVRRRCENCDSDDFNLNDYHDNSDFGNYQFQYDRSCGYELISPILKGYKGLDNCIEKIQALIACATVNINETCGIHFHYDFERSLNKMANLLAIWAMYEDLIMVTLPKHRRRNHYCGEVFIRPLDYELLQISLLSIKSYSELMDLARISRHSSLNTGTIRRTGTVEFRVLEGTTDVETIRVYGILFGAIINKVKNCDCVSLLTNYNINDTIENRIQKFGLEVSLDKTIVDFLIKRYTNFRESRL